MYTSNLQKYLRFLKKEEEKKTRAWQNHLRFELGSFSVRLQALLGFPQMVFTVKYICSACIVFKANLWFVVVHQGLTVKQKLGRSDTFISIYIYREREKEKLKSNSKEMRKNIKILTGNELQHDPLLHSHLWFPWATGCNRTGLKTACGSRLCSSSSSRAHCKRISSFMLLKHWMLSWIHLEAKRMEGRPPPPLWIKRVLMMCKAD